MLFLALACSEYRLQEEDSDPADTPDETDVVADTDTDPLPDPECEAFEAPAIDVPYDESCGTDLGNFDPVVEWAELGSGGSMSIPIVADLDGDGVPEITLSMCDPVAWTECALQSWHGDGSGWYASSDVPVGYGTGAAVADLDDDGRPDVVTVETDGDGAFRVVALDWTLAREWASDWFSDGEMDYSSYPAISDMDHDGSPEVVVGRVILDAGGSTRGVGALGRGGAPLGAGSTEDTNSFPMDVDLDGVEEVVAGNALYTPDGATKASAAIPDGLPAVGDFDDDPEAEIVLASGRSLYLLDTDMTVIWGPHEYTQANIIGPPAVADLDGDGRTDFVVAIGSWLRAVDRDGGEMWRVPTRDPSGATGPAIFDFDGDGVPEVVYADEVDLLVVDGATGAVELRSSDHDSPTMYDVPTIADVDADGHAEVVVSHMGFDSGLSGFSVYGDRDDRWMPTRAVWNQHAFSNENVLDDLTIPVEAAPAFTGRDTFRAARVTGGHGTNLRASIVGVCTDDCDRGQLLVTARLENTGGAEMPAGVDVAIYVDKPPGEILVATGKTPAPIPPGRSSEGMTFTFPTAALQGGATAIWVIADDWGNSEGRLDECHEDDNKGVWPLQDGACD